MKIFSVILCGAVVLGGWQAGWGAGPGGQGANATASPIAQAASPVALPPPVVQPHDKNGNPMTAEQFAQANQARIDARTAAVIKRLEARQAKWRKNNPPAAGQPVN